jgi:succinate dehydrogenase / fumarate reductase iron-sulfur subunit
VEVILKISRFNPESDQKPYFQEFTVAAEGRQTVLDALLLARRQDPGLSFRRSCRSTICGSCAICVNSIPGLACQALLRDVAGVARRIKLEPLPRFRQLKDLVVDLDPFFESLKAVIPWVVARDDYSGQMAPDVSRKLEEPLSCILCGVCDAAMEITGKAKPAALVKGLRLSADPRDDLGAHRMRLMKAPVEILKLFVRDLPNKCPKGIIIPGNF